MFPVSYYLYLYFKEEISPKLLQFNIFKTLLIKIELLFMVLLDCNTDLLKIYAVLSQKRIHENILRPFNLNEKYLRCFQAS